jgi:hypothetical protein
VSVALRRLTRAELSELVASAPPAGAPLDDGAREALAARLREGRAERPRRLDAYLVERAGRPGEPFAWSARLARRALGTPALVRLRAGRALRHAVLDALDDELARAATGAARPGSLGHWLAHAEPAVRALCVAEAQGWVIEAVEVARALGHPWSAAASDAFYVVEGARTTLRARRDLLVEGGAVTLRLRAGAPGPSAGAGLRADLAVLALADLEGHAPARLLGAWPEAGVVLSVDGSPEDLGAGLRDLARAGAALGRRLALAA